MRSNDGVARQTSVPAGDTVCELVIAFAAWRREIPFIALALRQNTSTLFFNLRQCQTFPFAIGNFDQSVVDFVSEWLKTKRCAQNFHGFARSLERARYIREVLWPALFARKQVVQHRSAFGGLLAPVRIQHRVTPTLQATLNVEVGFAMTDVIEERHACFSFRGQQLSISRFCANQRKTAICLLFTDHNIRRVWMLHANDVIAGIHMMDFARHAA